MAKAQAAETFESILDVQADKVERPKPAPAGTYDVLVKGMPEHGKSSKQQTPFVRFTYVFQAALDDVDEDALAEWLTDSDGQPMAISERSIRDTYYTTPDAMFRLTDTLENMGIDLTDKRVRACLDETPNASLRILVGHRPSDDGEQVFAEVKRTMKAK